MKIVNVVINIEADDRNKGDENLQPKSIVMNGSVWKLPTELFPRDIRFISNLEQLIKNYNYGGDKQ